MKGLLCHGDDMTSRKKGGNQPGAGCLLGIVLLSAHHSLKFSSPAGQTVKSFRMGQHLFENQFFNWRESLVIDKDCPGPDKNLNHINPAGAVGRT